MKIDDQLLTEIDEEYITKLVNKDIESLANLALNLIEDLKEARERLNQNPSNSSVPSGSLAPWDKGLPKDGQDDKTEGDEVSAENSSSDSKEDSDEECSGESNPDSTKETRRKPGRQKGSQGFGRTQRLPITDTKHHNCERCQACNTSLLEFERPYTGFYSINVIFGNTESPGLKLTNTHHLYYLAICPTCELKNQTKPWRAPADNESWENVGLTEWRLIGADLAALICYLCMEMRVSRRKVQLFLSDILGLELSLGCLQSCLIETARALEPVEEILIQDILDEPLIHADETSLKQSGQLLWLWVFVGAHTALFLVGRRTKTIFTDLIESSQKAFTGWLMSDGYMVYRSYKQRLRCWAHLERKAQGLVDSLVWESKVQGEQMLVILKYLMDAIYDTRKGPDKGTISIRGKYQEELQRLRKLCKEMSESNHKKTRELGVEFLNDWDAIFRILECPAWPLTNNEAERALRHWVILRRMSYGTRSAQGSRALGLFASVIETCRLRKSSPILYIRDVIALRRQGKDAPALADKVA